LKIRNLLEQAIDAVAHVEREYLNRNGSVFKPWDRLAAPTNVAVVVEAHRTAT
jgi:hypothetical protein